MTQMLGPEAQSPETADCGFFVPEVDPERQAQKPYRPTQAEIDEAQAALRELMQTDDADARYRRGLNDLVSSRGDRSRSADAEFYIRHETLAAVANFAYDRMPSDAAIHVAIDGAVGE